MISTIETLEQATVQQHFVTFYSPGTIVAETTEKPIAAWDVDAAVKMAEAITERHNARPYGFRFTTRGREPGELDSEVAASSVFYFLSGKVETIEQVRERNDPKERILLSNMEGNGWKRVIRITRGWSWTQPLDDGDVVLNEE
jgi:hypothetical protein